MKSPYKTNVFTGLISALIFSLIGTAHAGVVKSVQGEIPSGQFAGEMLLHAGNDIPFVSAPEIIFHAPVIMDSDLLGHDGAIEPVFAIADGPIKDNGRVEILSPNSWMESTQWPSFQLLQGDVDENIYGPRSHLGNLEDDPNRALFEKNLTRGILNPTDSGVSPGTNGSPSNLMEEMVDSLLTYHRVDGANDGSGQTGVQYPPVPGVPPGDVAGLKEYINRLGSFLGTQSGISYNPAPSGKDRNGYRAQVAEAAAPEIKDHVMNEFMAFVDGMQNHKLKMFVKLALKNAQPEFWRAPSSASGKFHPADEINFGGLLVHSMRDAVLGRLLSQYFGLAPERHEYISAALLLHDIQKGGIPWKHDHAPGHAPESGYDPAHGPIAADWLKNFEKECGPDCDSIIEDVRDHMAQWNRPVPTLPANLEEQIVSYADYLASRDDVYIAWRTSPARKTTTP